MDLERIEFAEIVLRDPGVLADIPVFRDASGWWYELGGIGTSRLRVDRSGGAFSEIPITKEPDSELLEESHLKLPVSMLECSILPDCKEGVVLSLFVSMFPLSTES